MKNQIVNRKLSSLKENPKNPRFIRDEKFEALVESLSEFEKMLKLRPIVIQPDGTILGGNMRFKAAQELGLKTIPCIVADDLSEDEIKEFIIKDNGHFGEYDWGIIRSDWDIPVVEAWGLEVPKEEQPKTVSFEVTKKYKLTVLCKDEQDLIALHQRLLNEGYDVKAPTLKT